MQTDAARKCVKTGKGEHDMTLKECVVSMLKFKNITQTDLTQRLGLKRQSSVANALYRGNMTVETLVKYCAACGYEVAIQPNKLPGSRPKGQFVIDQTGPSDGKKVDEE